MDVPDGAIEELPSLEATLARGRPVLVRVLTSSMAPTVAPGQTVTARARTACAGDVVLVRSRGAFTLHRLIARLGPRWLHAGDAPGSRAGFCRPDDVLAVADLERRRPRRAAQAALLFGAVGRSVLRRLRV